MASNPLEKISVANDTISGAISTISSKKEFIGKQIINTVLLFVILLVFGCLDFASLTFHVEYIFQTSFWATVVSKTIAGVCAFNIGVNIMWDVELKKDLILQEAITTYKKLITYKQNDFEYYVVRIYNPQEKTKAYISQINRSIYWLNKFSKAKDRLLYSSDLPERQEEKKTNKYCIRRKELEDLKDPEFIKKNLDSLKVKYYEVDATSFDLEIDGSVATRGVKTVGHVGLGKAKASANVVFGMVGFSMFLTAVGLELNGQEFVDQMEAFWNYLLKCATDLGIILWQSFRGMLRTRKIISSELTQPYVGRNKVLTDYLEWRLSTNQPNSLAYQELHKDDDVQEIEITEEALKEITKKQSNNID